MPHLPRIIPVIDVQAGRAVHARGGDRARYRPVESTLHDSPDPIGLALACRDRLGLGELYVADLDALAGAPPAISLYRDLAALGLALWVDAGVRDAGDVAPLIDRGVDVVIAGLETVRGPSALREAAEAAGPDRLAFSLDLRGGRPLVATCAGWGTDDPIHLAERAVAAGVGRLIVLDLARVGQGTGTGTLPLLRALHAAHPSLELVAGGGVAGVQDLRDLGDAGAVAALVGSALHDGRLGVADFGRSAG